MRKFVVASMVVAFAWLAFSLTSGAQDDKKTTIKEVMKVAMKGKLADKVAKGQATDIEKKQLAGLFAALHDNKPPKGEQGSWDAKTQALVDAANGVLEGKAGSAEVLAKIDCMGCHSAHKGK